MSKEQGFDGNQVRSRAQRHAFSGPLTASDLDVADALGSFERALKVAKQLA